MKRCYLAGPMTGYPDLNFAVFHRAAARLRAAGYEVANPAEINPDQSSSWEACMRNDIAQLVTCDFVVVLPGWDRSRGASLEVYIAEKLGMPRLTVDRALKLEPTT